jgi:hypothetical protein
MRKVFQHHRLVEHPGGRLDNSDGRDPFHAEVGERLVHAAIEGDLLELLGHDPSMHLLGHFDEFDLAAQRHKRKIKLLGEPLHRLRQWHPGCQFDHDPECTGGGEAAQVPFGRLAQRRAGGKDQLAALQQGRQIRDVTDMDPADLFVPSARAEHLGTPGLEDGQIDHLSHRKRHLHSVKNRGVSLTLCT